MSTTSHKILDNLDEMENSLNEWEYSPDIINNKQSEKLYAYKDREEQEKKGLTTTWTG